MLNLPNEQTVRAVLEQPLASDLRKLLEDRLADMLHCGLQEHTHLFVIELEDTPGEVEAALGFTPKLEDSEWFERHGGGWWELLYSVGKEGFAYLVLVEEGALR